MGKYSALYIPMKTEVDAINWRLEIGFVALPNLIKFKPQLLEATASGSTDCFSNLVELKNELLAEKYDLNTIDFASLYAVKKYSDYSFVDLVNDSTAPELNFLINKAGQSIEAQKAFFREKAKELQENQVKFIRGVLALKELLAILYPKDFIPHLVSIHPKYLSCPFVYHWVDYNQTLVAAKNEQYQSAIERLNVFGQAIKLDNRKTSQRKIYNNIRTESLYHFISENITEIRKNNLSEESVNFFIAFLDKEFNLSPINKNLIYDLKKSPKELTLEVFVEAGEINEPHAFKTIQKKNRKLLHERYEFGFFEIKKGLEMHFLNFIDHLEKNKPLLRLSRYDHIVEDF